MPFHSNSEFKIRILGWGALDDDSGALRVGGGGGREEEGRGGGRAGDGRGMGRFELASAPPRSKGLPGVSA